MGKTINAIIILFLILSCSASPNLPANVSFVCDCSPSESVIKSIVTVAKSIGFIEDKILIKQNAPYEKRLALDMVLKQRPQAILIIHIHMGQFSIVFGDKDNSKFTPEDQETIDLLQEGLDQKMPGAFHLKFNIPP